ncbi:MAG: preprotein translocase subunit SecG [Clostridia bacterium]
MEILKYALIVIYIIVAAAIIILTLVQEKEDNGASGAITDTATNNFYDKNKGRTKAGKQKKMDNYIRSNICNFNNYIRNCIYVNKII